MKGNFYKDIKDGIWKTDIKRNTPFVDLQLFYLNKLDSFFSLAADKCELEFILCLIRFTGMRDAGWDPFENLKETYETFHKIQSLNKLREVEKAHYALFTYGLIIEALVPYNLLANLMSVIEGDRYRLNNFPDTIDRKTGKTRSQTMSSIIDQLKSRAKKLNLDLDFFDDFVDNHLRNGVFHSDYSIYWPEVRINNPVKRYTHDEWTLLVNRAFAYIQALFILEQFYTSTYAEPATVKPHPEFNTNGGQITTIVRKGYGVIGIKDTWTKEQIARGAIPHRLGRFLPYEIDLIEQGQLLLPPDRIRKFNKRINHLPRFLKIYLVKKFRKTFGFKK